MVEILSSVCFSTKYQKKMKNLKTYILAGIAMLVGSASVSAQDFVMNESEAGLGSLAAYEQQRLEELPYIQAYQAEDGSILKAADAVGWGIEIFGGASYMHVDNYFTPEAGLSVRYDAKKVSYRVSASALWREYNAESIEPGKKYMSYSADAAFHVNLINRGWHVNVLSLYANIGYMYGQHRYAVKAETEEGTWSTVVKHNGSGITFGGGLEYRAQFFATGNALVLRAGYKTLPNTYVNNTHIEGMVYVSLGFNFGINRSRVRN